MKRQHVEAWLGATLPGEGLQAYVVGGPANGTALDATDSPESGHPADLHVHVSARSFDPALRISPHANICAVLGDRRLAIASVGGLVSARPKELLRDAERGDFRCEWWINDQSEAPTAFYCNIVLRFSDGSWAALGAATKLLGRTVKSAGLASEFVSALGSDAMEIDWRDPPTP